jgi:hypothetical protein
MNGSAYEYQAYFNPAINYNLALPAGITNVKIWTDLGTRVDGANGGQTIGLQANNANAWISFDVDDQSFEIPFVLDRSNPFTNLFVVVFPGVENVLVERYVGAAWDGTFQYRADNSTWFYAPGATSVRFRAGSSLGMSFQVSGILAADTSFRIIRVPVDTITVTGITANCDLAIVGTDWVYTFTPKVAGDEHEFVVFANRDYTLRVRIGTAVTPINNVTPGDIVDLVDLGIMPASTPIVAMSAELFDVVIEVPDDLDVEDIDEVA